MTSFELALERNLPLDLADALAAVRTLDADAADVCRLAGFDGPALVGCRLQQIEERRREIKRAVRKMVGE